MNLIKDHASKTKQGNMYFGGINGLTAFNPHAITISHFKPKVVFDTFEVNGVSRKDISKTKLKYQENTIKVSFFTNDYSHSNSIQYEYKLEGSSDKWHTIGDNSIIFANLSPGHYRLRVKAKTHHGVEGEESVVNFVIKKPCYASNLAICIYILLIVLAINRYRHRVKILDKLVNERTIKLKYEAEKNEELLKKVLKLEQNKNNYFVNLSHELRTPLNVLSSIQQLIKDLCNKEETIPSEKISSYMDMMGRNTFRLLNLINNLIDNSKIENNYYTLTKTDEDIVNLVEDTIFDMKSHIDKKGIEIIFDTDIEEKIVRCDKTEIERCIVNLISNAVKFTPTGGLIEVTVTDLFDRVKISVKDNGIGISEENKKLIFNRFSQVIDDKSESKGGSGLGLTICKQLITLHNGDIYVESEIGVGSEFIIILPVNNDIEI